VLGLFIPAFGCPFEQRIIRKLGKAEALRQSEERLPLHKTI